MLADAFYLARKDLGHMFRGRETWLWAFAMPILFFYFIGTVTGGYGRPASTAEPLGLYAPPAAGFLVDRLAGRLETLGYQVRRVQDPRALAGFTRRLTVPANFTESVVAGQRVVLTLSREGGGLAADSDEIRVKRAAYELLADTVIARAEQSAVTPAALDALAAAPHDITVHVVPAGKRKTIPGGFEQAVPGTMVMFVLLVMFTTGGVTLSQERHAGLLWRLASTPMSRTAVVTGKWLSRFALGLVQTAFGMAAGTLLFHVDWGPNVVAVALLLAVYAALAAGAGMLLGNFGRTDAQVIGLGVILSNLLAMAGGCWWPVEVTPLWAQKAALLLPTGWAMDGLHKLISFGDSPAAVIPHALALAAGALVAGWVLARNFRFQ